MPVPNQRADMSEETVGDGETGEDEETGEEPSPSIHRCDYCRLPIPATPLEMEIEGTTYEFCSAACREALADSDRVHTEYHGFRRLETGVSALDASLPEGVPRNSFVMLTDLAGSRMEAIRAELVWRALQRGEPAVLISFLEPPVSVIQEFVTLEWNVLPSLENGDLQILDCFSYRVADRERMYERMNTWNTHLWDIAEPATTTVRDPTDMGQLQDRLDGLLEDAGMHDEGIIVLDSLTELGSLVQPVQAYNFLKDVRADVCKGRFVPIFAGATVTGDGEGFPHDLGYAVDGIIELRLNDEMIDGALIKELRVRKMNGVLTYPERQVYEYTAGEGIVTFDPVAQMEAAADDGEDGAGEADDGAEAEAAGTGE
jgi:KaiC/GvpD/RAD55 family RecA-like ATPase/YHS domain-containing protein